MTKKQKHPEKSAGTLIIVGPMPFPVSALKSYITEADVGLIFIDGGLVHAKKFQKKAPHLYKSSTSIGDGDSSKKKMTIKKKSQKSSDLAFLLSKLTGKLAPTRCLFVGFLGGRIDHELCNLGEIALYLKQFQEFNAPLIQLDNKIIFLGKGTHHAHIHGTFSLASFETNKIKLTGECEYKATSWLEMPPLSSRGVSNIGYGEILIETKRPLAIIRA